MKKIIVPTDFSEVGVNAFRFAQELAKRENSQILLLHVYHPSFDVDNPYLSVDFGQFEKVKRETLLQFAKKYTTSVETTVAIEDTTIQTELRVGFAAEEIVKASAEADLVIMGTTGRGDALEKVFGKVSIHVAQNASCPVLLVPPNQTFSGFHNLLFASSDRPEDENLLRKIFSFSSFDIKTLHFVHVDEQKTEKYEVLDIDFEHITRPYVPDIELKLARIGCTQIWSGIDQYAEDHAVDLIIMGTIRRGFLKKLFHQSQTKGMILHTQKPLLVLHFQH